MWKIGSWNREIRMSTDAEIPAQTQAKIRAGAIAVLVLCVIFAVIYIETLGYGSDQSEYWPGPYRPIGVVRKTGFKASLLRADLESYTSLERFHGGPTSWGREGTIHIEGWIYNYAPEDVNVTLFLHVTDGTKSVPGMNMSEFWQDYYFPIGVVTKNGGKKWFEWKQRYNPFDPTTATFFYRLIPTR